MAGSLGDLAFEIGVAGAVTGVAGVERDRARVEPVRSRIKRLMSLPPRCYFCGGLLWSTLLGLIATTGVVLSGQKPAVSEPMHSLTCQ
jgi:hypothetical protein